MPHMVDAYVYTHAYTHTLISKKAVSIKSPMKYCNQVQFAYYFEFCIHFAFTRGLFFACFLVETIKQVHALFCFVVFYVVLVT